MHTPYIVSQDWLRSSSGGVELPSSTNDLSLLLARHKTDIIEECRNLLKLNGSDYRNQEFNRLLLHRRLALAIGHGMVYNAAVKDNIDPDMIALYEAGVVKLDSSLYSEYIGIDRIVQMGMESRTATALLCRIEEGRHLCQSTNHLSGGICIIH